MAKYTQESLKHKRDSQESNCTNLIASNASCPIDPERFTAFQLHLDHLILQLLPAIKHTLMFIHVKTQMQAGAAALL